MSWLSRIIAQLPAQTGHGLIHRAGDQYAAIIPHLPQQLFAREDGSFVLVEKLQESQFLAAQLVVAIRMLR